MKCPWFVSLFAVLLSACGDGEVGNSDLTTEPATPFDTTSRNDWRVEDASWDGPSNDVEKPDTTVALNTQSAQSGSNSIYYEVYQPTFCTPTSPCPLLILVPDMTNAGTQEFSCCASKLASTLKCNVVVYNPPGRGVGKNLSEGSEDFGGTAGQDALIHVSNSARKHPYVDASNIGILSLGYGLTTAAAAIARFQAGSQAFSHYLIDIEGPTNRCYVTQSPFYVDKKAGWYINADGPGITSTRCDFDFWDRLSKFPPGTSSDGKGTDGTPNSYICNQNAFPLKQTGKTCNDDSWWLQREPKQFLTKIKVHYLRVQFLCDHVQPTRYASREAMAWASIGQTASYQLNSAPINNSLKGYSEADLIDSKVYLNPSVGQGFGGATYCPGYDFKSMTKEQLLLKVLPAHILKMQKRVGG